MMARIPASVAEFLKSRRIAVTGVSRGGMSPANAIFKRLAECGYEVFAVNPKATRIADAPCYPDLRSVPGDLDAVVVASPPASGIDIVRQCAERGIHRVWFHRSVGDGSVSADAVRECRERGIEPIVGGCPMMFCGNVDIAHRCMKWVLQWTGRV